MSEEDYNFDKLSQKQRDVLGWIAINEDGGHNPRTLKALLGKGFIEEFEETLPGRFPVKVKRYAVPLHVHIRWCEWCSKNCEDDV